LAVALLTVAILLMLVLVMLILVPTIGNEFSRLSNNLPNYADTISTVLIPEIESRLRTRLPHSVDDWVTLIQANRDTINQIAAKLSAPVTHFVQRSVSSVLGFITGLLTLIVIPVAWFFLLRDIDRLNARMADLIPPRRREGFLSFLRQVDEIMSNFLHGQIIVALIDACLYSIGLWLILDIPLGLVIGILAGFAAIVPYLGLLLGIVPALVMAFLQYQDWQHPLGVIAVFGVAQAIEGNLITPKIVGNKLGLHPVTVIFALLVWAELGGFLGMIVAVPLTAVLQVLVLRLLERYKASPLFQGPA
jgi:predicted PurR-regulated permease PerM